MRACDKAPCSSDCVDWRDAEGEIGQIVGKTPRRIRQGKNGIIRLGHAERRVESRKWDSVKREAHHGD